jgi:hypothetical protein
MNKATAKPSTWTLLFKHGKQTILLFTESLTPVSAIKKELLSILQERYPSGLPGPSPLDPKSPIPSSATEIALGSLDDPLADEKTWTVLNTGATGLKETPISLGLKDGSILAFSFVNDPEEDDPEFVVEWSSYDDHYDQDPGEAMEDN